MAQGSSGKTLGRRPLRIGGASGFWGDAALATAQLLQAGGLDFIVYDYLAEITMAILARARARDPAAGYATDFLTGAMTAQNLGEISRQGVRILSNAGGVNPVACAAALRARIAAAGLDLRVATVTGDDLMGQVDEIRRCAPSEMFSGAAFPDPRRIVSINAYLGAFPIKAALDAGADIVVTGRSVDSAVTLAAAAHQFGWRPEDLDQLAGGALAGHILECGTQATGGNFTDWRPEPAFYADMGYPIAEIFADGSFDLTKPTGSAGLVSRATVAEQMVYEIGDPAAYVLPDVVCDLTEVTITDIGKDRVHVKGARGVSVPGSLKTCLTWQDGYRGGQFFTYYAPQAAARARTFAKAALQRARASLARQGLVDFSHVSLEVLGTQSQFGAFAKGGDEAREVVLKLAARHPEKEGIETLLREATGLGLAAPPGLSGFAGTRPRPSPVLALFSFLTPKHKLAIKVHVDAGEIPFRPPTQGETTAAPVRPTPAPPAPPAVSQRHRVPLVRLAWGRSGDKGDSVNIGLIARDPTFLPWIWAALDTAFLRRTFGHFLADDAEIRRYHLPGINAMNILLSRVLEGGGTSSLRNDPQGKGYAGLLLAGEIELPVGFPEKGQC